MYDHQLLCDSGSYSGGGFDAVGSPVLLSPLFQHRHRCPSESDYSSMSETSRSEVQYSYWTVVKIVVVLELASFLSSLSRDDLQNRSNVRPCVHPSMQCQHLNPKVPRPLGRHRWNLTCIFYGSWGRTSRKQDVEFWPRAARSDPVIQASTAFYKDQGVS